MSSRLGIRLSPQHSLCLNVSLIFQSARLFCSRRIRQAHLMRNISANNPFLQRDWGISTASLSNCFSSCLSLSLRQSKLRRSLTTLDGQTEYACSVEITELPGDMQSRARGDRGTLLQNIKYLLGSYAPDLPKKKRMS